MVFSAMNVLNGSFGVAVGIAGPRSGGSDWTVMTPRLGSLTVASESEAEALAIRLERSRA